MSTVNTMEMPEFKYENFKGWVIRYTIDEYNTRLWALCDILGALKISNITLVQKRIDNDEKVLAFRHDDGEPIGTGMWLITDEGFMHLLKTSRMPERDDMSVWLDVIINGVPEDEGLPSCKSPDVEISVADFGDGYIRVFVKDGAPWFILKDVCDILGIRNARDVASRLDMDEKVGVGITDVDSDGIARTRIHTAIREGGAYFIATISRKPEANELRKWVFNEVIPTIARTGEYKMKSKPALMLYGMNPDIRLEDATKRINEYNLMNSDEPMDSSTFLEVATNGKLGRTKFYQWMRDKGYYAKEGTSNLLCGNWAASDWFKVYWYTDYSTGVKSPIIKITRNGQLGLIEAMSADGIL